MANEYLYGAYGHIGETIAQSSIQAGTVPVYIGTAPINLIRDYANLNLINYPVKITNYVNAQKKLGIASDWNKFNLCEAMAAHFDNSLGNVGPIYLINVLNPDIHRKSEATQINLAFTNGRAIIKSDTIIIDTFALADKVENVDYSLDYNFAKGTLMITSLSDKNTETIAASYYEIIPEAVTAEDIIGTVTSDGEYSGLKSILLMYQEHNAVTNLIGCPKWSSTPAVYNAMCTIAAQINGHWDAFVCADIPVDEAANIEAAKTWKKTNAYTNERSKVFWPKATDNTNRIFHLSTLGIVELMRADYSHSSIPMETCGNKQIPVVKQYFGETSKNKGFDSQEAKELTSNGITTCTFWGGNWVLFGDHTAAYTYGADVDARAIFDVSMRMLFYITNSFQREWGTTIDEPFTTQLKERILNREQEKLDGLVAAGALIGEPNILFLESENSTTDMMNGDFRWDLQCTPTPPLKSATIYVAYSDAGFSAYFVDSE